MRNSSPSFTSYTSIWSVGSSRRRTLISPIGVGRRSSSSKFALTGELRQACPGGKTSPAVGMWSNSDDVAGDRVGGVQRAQVGAAEAAVRGKAVAVDLEEVDNRAVGSTTRTPCSMVDAT